VLGAIYIGKPPVKSTSSKISQAYLIKSTPPNQLVVVLGHHRIVVQGDQVVAISLMAREN
jgi:hypothetical protein